MLLNYPTSEYKLEYKNLPIELRKKIWEENLKFRECCAENNRLQHFWYFQKNHGLTEGHTVSNGHANTSTSTTETVENEVSEINETVCEPSETQTDSNTASKAENAQKKVLKSALKCTQTEDGASTSNTFLRDVAIQTPKWETIMKRIQELKPTKVVTEPIFSTNICKESRNARCKSASPKCSTRNLVQLEKKIPFLSYGWNDSKRDIGSKRTFNINASAEEVYPAALHALTRRKDMHKRSEAMRRQRPSTAPLLSPVNHSSLWMTEYQDIFSRPQSAPFASSKSVRLQ